MTNLREMIQLHDCRAYWHGDHRTYINVLNERAEGGLRYKIKLGLRCSQVGES